MRGRVLRCLPIVGIGALVMGFLALPGAEERVTMLLRDGKTVEARQVLRDLYRSGDRRPQILMQLADLEDNAGHIRESVTLFEDYVSVRPKDAQALERLAGLYTRLGEREKAYAARELVLRLAPTAESAARLLALYRLNGRTDDEFRLLNELYATPLMTPAGLLRLGALAASRQNLALATQALMRFDAVGDQRETSPRMLLFQILLDQKRHAEAYDLAARWSTSWKDAQRATELALSFARVGEEMRVRHLALDAGRTLKDFELRLANVLARRGHARISRGVLSDWAAAPWQRTSRQIADYISLASQTGDPVAPVRLLKLLVRKGAAPERVALLADGVFEAYGADALAPLRSLLTADTLRHRPLFGAKLALSEHNPASALRYFRQVDVFALSRDERNAWLRVGKDLDPNGIYRSLFANWKKRAMPVDLAVALADMASQRGDRRVHTAVAASMRSKQNMRLSALMR